MTLAPIVLPPEVIKLLNEILDHQVKNRGHGTAAFYASYDYRAGQFPAWVEKAENMLKNSTEDKSCG